MAIRNLRSKGKIVSRFYTSNREHMKLSTAIEILFDELSWLKYKLGVKKAKYVSRIILELTKSGN